MLCQRLILGLCATGFASEVLSLSRFKSTGGASGTPIFSFDKALGHASHFSP